MSGPVRDGNAMVRQMGPHRVPGCFSFRTAADAADLAQSLPNAVAMFREGEGVSLIEPCDCAAPMAMAQITLTVTSALDGVGLTAAVSAALARAGIACNMVAAHHHDHVFVPAGRAEDALAVLRDLSQSAGLPRDD